MRLSDKNRNLFDLCCWYFAHREAAYSYRVSSTAAKNNFLLTQTGGGYCWIPPTISERLEVANKRMKLVGECPVQYFLEVFEPEDGSIIKSSNVDYREIFNLVEQYELGCKTQLEAILEQIPYDIPMVTEIKIKYLSFNNFSNRMPRVVVDDLGLGLIHIPPYTIPPNFITPKSFIGNTSCVNNAQSPYVRCAVNPDGPCNGCIHYEARKS